MNRSVIIQIVKPVNYLTSDFVHTVSQKTLLITLVCVKYPSASACLK